MRRLKHQLDTEGKELKKEQKDFESDKRRLNMEAENLIKSERDKFEKNKRVFERQFKAMKNLPNRKERQEIDGLKIELKEM